LGGKVKQFTRIIQLLGCFSYVIIQIFIIFAPHTCRTDDDTLLSEERVCGRPADGLKG